jgi:hypothetical protein
MSGTDGNQRRSQQGPYDPFFIPSTILSATASYQQPHSILTTLPLEIRVLIFRHLKVTCYQVCLALTCKAMASIAIIPNAMASWRGWRDKTYLFYLFQKMPRPGAEVDHYIPSHLRLCRACFRFRLIRREDSEAKVQSELMDTQKDFERWSERCTKCRECFAACRKTYWREQSYEEDENRWDVLKYRMDKP